MRQKTRMIVLLAMCILVQTTLAQDALKAIREHYAAAKEYVSQTAEIEAEGETYPVPQYFTARVKQNLPGTGYHEEEVLMYYREEGEDEQIYPSLYLDFAIMKYNFAARKFYEEFLYDAQGQIQFIFASIPDFIDDMFYEFRFYHDSGKLIQVIVKRHSMSGGDFTTIYTGKTIPKEYADYYHARYDLSKRIMNIFKAIDDARQL